LQLGTAIPSDRSNKRRDLAGNEADLQPSIIIHEDRTLTEMGNRDLGLVTAVVGEPDPLLSFIGDPGDVHLLMILRWFFAEQVWEDLARFHAPTVSGFDALLDPPGQVDAHASENLGVVGQRDGHLNSFREARLHRPS
jgi:hypothetical protein